MRSWVKLILRRSCTKRSSRCSRTTCWPMLESVSCCWAQVTPILFYFLLLCSALLPSALHCIALHCSACPILSLAYSAAPVRRAYLSYNSCSACYAELFCAAPYYSKLNYDMLCVLFSSFHCSPHSFHLFSLHLPSLDAALYSPLLTNLLSFLIYFLPPFFLPPSLSFFLSPDHRKSHQRHTQLPFICLPIHSVAHLCKLLSAPALIRLDI